MFDKLAIASGVKMARISMNLMRKSNSADFPNITILAPELTPHTTIVDG